MLTFETHLCSTLSLLPNQHANASGVYSAFTASSVSGNSGSSSSSNSTAPTGAGSGSGSGAPPSGSGSGIGGNAGGSALSSEPDDNLTFLRSIWPTTSEGVSEIHSVLPGFYVSRSIHTHVKVHLDVTQNANGTILSNK